MGVPELLNWIKQKYPRVVRETSPTFEGYDMLFVDMPQYIVTISKLMSKPYSNSSMLICKIFLMIDRLVQFAKPKEVIFFSFECKNGFLPYAKAITKRIRKMQNSIEESKRLIVFTEEKDNNELLDIDELNLDDDNEFKKILQELSKESNVDSSTFMEKAQEIVDKINQNRSINAKNEIPQLLTIRRKIS